MEFVQFHPTALKDKFILISESARGEGGYLLTKEGKRFVDELLPRDIVARAIYEKIVNDDEIFLDLRHLGLEKIMHLMPQEYKLCYEFTGLKMDIDLIPITPASHYTMGGIKVDIDGKTSLKSLYAVGECASNGVHGANRLGGNSLLEITTFGRHIANCILTSNNKLEEKEYDTFLNDKILIKKLFEHNKEKEDFYKAKDEIGKIMFENVGVFRDDKSLNIALDKINYYINNIDNFSITDKNKVYNTNLKDYLEFKNILFLSKVIIKSALSRKESRGAHYRVDFKELNKEYDKSTLFNNGDLYE